MKSLFTLLFIFTALSFRASAQDEQLTRPQTTAAVASEAVARQEANPTRTYMQAGRQVHGSCACSIAMCN